MLVRTRLSIQMFTIEYLYCHYRASEQPWWEEYLWPCCRVCVFDWSGSLILEKFHVLFSAFSSGSLFMWPFIKQLRLMQPYKHFISTYYLFISAFISGAKSSSLARQDEGRVSQGVMTPCFLLCSLNFDLLSWCVFVDMRKKGGGCRLHIWNKVNPQRD